MRRDLALASALVLLVALAACSSGQADDVPASSPAPSPPPSTSPPPEPQRFDGVDLAAALVPNGAVAWGTETIDPADPYLDPAAFAASPACRDAVAAHVAIEPLEAVVGGEVSQGETLALVTVLRMASPQEAQAYLDALDAAGAACTDVVGTATVPYGTIILETRGGDANALSGVGMTQIFTGADGTFHGSLRAYATLDELVVTSASEGIMEDWDVALRDDILLQLGALASAAP